MVKMNLKRHLAVSMAAFMVITPMAAMGNGFDSFAQGVDEDVEMGASSEASISLENAEISDIDDIFYTGVAVTPSPDVTLGENSLTLGTDYELSYENNINAGTATVTVSGIGDYTGSVSKDFRIEPMPLDSSALEFWFQGGDAVKYTGGFETPSVEIMNWDTFTQYTEGQDYDVSYEDCLDIGTAYAVVTGTDTGNMTGEKRLEYYIVDPCEWAIPQDLTATVQKVPHDDNGAVISGETVVTVAFTVDPSVKHVDFYAWGVTADGSMEGELIGPYTTEVPDPEASEPESWMWTAVEGEENRYTYDLCIPTLACGEEQEVMMESDMTYLNGLKENDLVTITATGNARVTVESSESDQTRLVETDPSEKITFAITPDSEGQTFEPVAEVISLEDAEMAAIEGQAYTGKAVKPTVTITYGEATLTEGTDYELTYTDNEEVGIATVTATGKGDYTGTLTGEFVIYGWRKAGGQYFYLDQSGNWATGWKPIDMEWYYFDQNSVMLTKFQKIGKKWYYFGTDGAMKTSWIQDNSKWYCFDTDGAMHIGWLQDNNKWYYFDTDGAMYTGWLHADKLWYYFNTDGVMHTGWLKDNDQWYYFNTNGVMHTSWLKDNDQWYYFNTSGVMLTGWQRIEGKWYNFNNDGAMCLDWQKFGNNWYYFDTDGSMCSEWQKVDRNWYYLGTDGAMKTGWQEINKDWYYFGTTGVMRNGWELIGNKWYYFQNGVMVTGWKKVGGDWYYFDANGAMVTGSQMIDGVSYYFDETGGWLHR